jgi:DNA end-binding protein Ku
LCHPWRRRKQPVPQAVWTGSISFGLVNIPVKLYVATSPKDVRFHQFEGGTGRRIRYRRMAAGAAPEDLDDAMTERLRDEGDEASSPRPDVVAPPTEAPPETEVSWDEVVKGYEIEPGRVVTVSQEELREISPERSRVLEVEQFVDLEDIDPVYFEKSYYVVPQHGEESERPYSLLLWAMREANRVAIGRFTLRTKDHLSAVRPAEDVLMLHTLFYADEIRERKEVWTPRLDKPGDRELRLAHQLVEALEGKWDPSGYRDTYRERVLELLESKSEKAFVVQEEAEEAPASKIADLMEALKESVEAAREARQGTRRRPKRRAR